MQQRKPTEETFFVGTYTKDTNSVGLYQCTLAKDTGDIRVAKTVTVANPSFLTVDTRGQYLYASLDEDQLEREYRGRVASFRIDPVSKNLTLVNDQLTGGEPPTYISVDETGSHLFASYYGGGKVMVFPVSLDGVIGPSTDTAQHEGKGAHPDRQTRPHAHSIVSCPGNEFAVAADLGIDEALIYKLDPDAGTLAYQPSLSRKVQAGAGPRHITFHPNQRNAYMINELDSTISVFAFCPDSGSLDLLQTVPTLPDGFNDWNACADVHVHPNGRFLYGSNRGHDSIIVFQIEPESGKINYVGHHSTLGQCPRNFAISSGGEFMVIGNQESNELVVFGIDGSTGQLIANPSRVTIPSPACIVFLPENMA